MARKRNGGRDITNSSGKARLAVERATATRGVDPAKAVKPVVNTDTRLLCAWQLLEESRMGSVGFARYFELIGEVDAPVMRNALVEARTSSHGAGGFVAREFAVMIDGEETCLTVIVPANRRDAVNPFVSKLLATKPENLVERWFPHRDSAAFWMRYEYGGVIVWTYYDVVPQILDALKGHELPPSEAEAEEQSSGEQPLPEALTEEL